MTEALMKLMDMSVDQPTRRRAESRAKALWDEAARMRQSREEGEALGREEGKAGIARLMLRENMPFAEIAKWTGYSLPDIERLAAEMK